LNIQRLQILSKRFNEKGLTLVEVLISLALLSVIVLAFLPLFQSTFSSVRIADGITDATYIAQNSIEKLYNESNNENFLDDFDQGQRTYIDDIFGKFHVKEQIVFLQGESGLVRAVVRVYSDSEMSRQLAQMERYFILRD